MGGERNKKLHGPEERDEEELTEGRLFVDPESEATLVARLRDKIEETRTRDLVMRRRRIIASYTGCLHSCYSGTEHEETLEISESANRPQRRFEPTSPTTHKFSFDHVKMRCSLSENRKPLPCTPCPHHLSTEARAGMAITHLKIGTPQPGTDVVFPTPATHM